jgi:hypothetical protein
VYETPTGLHRFILRRAEPTHLAAIGNPPGY